jgi:TetR/AcrR family transcriptional regulator, transcriptional repressor for nem operon
LTVRSRMIYAENRREIMARPKNFNKDEVLRLAMQVFWQKGYEATSVQDLVESTKVNKQSLYDTFGDKHSLYLAALSSYQAENECQVSALFAENISAKEALRKLFDNVISEAISDLGRKGCFMNNATVELASQDEKIGKVCFDNMNSMEKKLFELIKRGQANNEISELLDAKSIAAFFFTAINGLRAVSKITQDKKKLEDIVKINLSVLD